VRETTHSQVWHDMRETTHSQVWHDPWAKPYVSATSLPNYSLHVCDMTHSSVWHESFIDIEHNSFMSAKQVSKSSVTFFRSSWLLSSYTWLYALFQEFGCRHITQYMCISVNVYMNAYIYTNECVCIFEYVHMYMYMKKGIYIHTYMYTHFYICVYTYRHIYIYINT